MIMPGSKQIDTRWTEIVFLLFYSCDKIKSACMMMEEQGFFFFTLATYMVLD